MKNNKHPEAIFIQLNTYCNATCINCPHVFTYKTVHPKGSMNEKTWKKILNDLIEMNYGGQVGFYLHHEPLIDVTLYDKIKDINLRTNAHVVISTNGALLNKEHRKKLIEAGPRKVHININSGIEEEYERSMGLNFKSTIENAQNFIKEAEGAISVEINCPVMEGYDVKSLEQLFPSTKVNLDYYANSRGGLIPDLYGKVKGSRFKIEEYCVQPSQNFNILFDGTVILCCIDWMHESKEDYGNINDSSIAELYSKVCEEEEGFKKGDYSKYNMCDICSEEMGFNKKSSKITKLKILITNHHLLDYTGSEVYTLTLTEQLLKYGHEVVIYSKYVDKIEGEFLNLNVPVVNHLEEIKELHFDIAHVHHNINAAEVRYFFQNLPIVYLSHGVLPFLEQPSIFNLGITHYVAVSEEVKNNLVSNGIQENDISMVGNIIDTHKFSSFKTVNSFPQKALVVSAKIGDEKKKRIEQACSYLGIECKFVGGRNGEVKREHIADLIVEADVVFSLGRGAIEAMLCERNVIVYDENGGDGLITKDNFDEIRKHNFSGRRFHRDFSIEELISLLKDCPQNDVRYVKDKAYELFAAEKVIHKLTAIYIKTIQEFIKDDSVDFKMLESFYKSLQDTRDYTKIVSQRKLSLNNVSSEKQISTKEILFKYNSKVDKLLRRSARANNVKSQMQLVDKQYDVLIPIYNAYEQVKVCVESVLRNTKSIHKIYLLDDASPDKNILPMLNAFAENDNRVIVVSAKKNLGFVGNMNVGFKLSNNDVIILNSDTEVTPNWIEKLNLCAQSDFQIGIVSPLSNNATILSVPEFNANNKLPKDISVDQFAKIVEECSNKDYPELPTAVGFCMLIKREVLNKIGYFDEIFGLGYGEENDFCERAKENGYKIVCCDNLYVHHYGEASFSSVEQISERRKTNQLKLESRWPNYAKEIFGFCRTNPLRRIQEKIYFDINKHNSSPHVLNVIHSYNAPGGTELHTSDVMERIKDSFRFSIMYPASLGLDYTDAKTSINKQGIREIKIAKENNLAVEYFNGMPGDLTSELIEQNFVNFLQGGDYNIVHFQHLLNWSSLLLPLIVKKLNKKVIITLHDYYLMCPEFNMIFPETLSRCNKPFASSTDEECLYCLGSKRRRRIPKNAQSLSNYLFERHEIIKNIFKNSDLLISPSEFVKQKFISAYGDDVAHKIKVLSHGIHPLKKVNRPKFEKYLYVGFLGNVTTIKGANILLALGKRLVGKDIRLEVFGNVAVEFSALLQEVGIKIHGGYEREKLYKLVKHIQLIIIPSIWDETFCLTLSEAMELGIPVIASDSGAMSERIIEGETGFLFKTGSAYDLENKLFKLLANPFLLEKVQKNLAQLKIKTIDENAEDYRSIYNDVLNSINKTVINSSKKLDLYDHRVITTSIVVLTYNALEYTKKFYQSLVDSKVKDYELIIIDNASTDGTIEYLKRSFVGITNAVVLFNENNLGFPAAVNQGINEAKGKYIVIVNNDIVLTKGWIERMIEIVESNSRIGLVGPISNDVSGLQKDKKANYKSIDNMHKYAAKVAEENKGEILQFPRVAFLCTLIKKEVIDKIGGLDERFSPGNYEDDDFCLRAQLAGYKTVIAKDVFIHHYGSKSFKANGNAAYQERLDINRAKFVDKWGVTPEEIWLENKQVKPRQIFYPINKDLFAQLFERTNVHIADNELVLAEEAISKAIDNFISGNGKIERSELLDLAGNICLANGNPEKAQEYFSLELDLIPSSSSACLGLGNVFIGSEQFVNAKTMIEWAVKNDQTNKVAKNRLSEINQLLGYAPNHNSLFENSVDEDRTESILQNIVDLFVADKYDEARMMVEENNEQLTQYVDSFDNDGDKAEYYNMKGFIYLSVDNNLARECFEKALGFNQTSSQACVGLGELFFLDNMLNEAKTMYEWGVFNDPTNQLAVNGLAKLNELLGFELAHNTLVKEIVFEDVFMEAAELYKKSQFHEAIEFIEQHVNSLSVLLDNGVTNVELSTLFNLKGFCYLGLSDEENAEAAFGKSININPESSQACAGIGVVFLSQGRTNDAKTMLEWALKNDNTNAIAKPTLAKVNEMLGFTLHHNSLMDVDSFESLFVQAYNFFKVSEFASVINLIEQHENEFSKSLDNGTSIEDFAALHNLKGFSYLSMGNSHEARKSFENALYINPTSSQACTGLGEIFFIEDQLEEAKNMFERGIKNDSQNNFAVESLANVNKLLGYSTEHSSLVEG